jgi:hypothetical protein
MKKFEPLSHRAAGAVLVMLLSACSSGPVVPDWKVSAKGAMERAVAAYLEGNVRVESAEFQKARQELSRTGRPEEIAKAELLRCASHVASLVFEPCTGFEPLRQDAPPPQRAYADYLAGRLQPQDAALLPPAQLAAAAPNADAAALKSVTDPLSQLVAAGVMFQGGRASPAVVTLAVDTASAQGWRRPLLAWLGVQAELAEKAGQAQDAARLRRRIELTQMPRP